MLRKMCVRGRVEVYIIEFKRSLKWCHSLAEFLLTDYSYILHFIQLAK